MHRFSTGTTASPFGTASAPPGQKSRWTSTTSSAAPGPREVDIDRRRLNQFRDFVFSWQILSTYGRCGHNCGGMDGRALFTDLYELTMIAGYYSARIAALATFELYVRDLPHNRSFLVAAGLEQALDYLEQLRFTAEDIRFIRSLPGLDRAPPDFFDS